MFNSTSPISIWWEGDSGQIVLVMEARGLSAGCSERRVTEEATEVSWGGIREGKVCRRRINKGGVTTGPRRKPQMDLRVNLSSI